MATIAAREAKNEFGLLLDTAQAEDVTITKKGREVAVLLSVKRFKELLKIQESWEDYYWRKKAEEAEQEGYISADETEKALQALRNR